MYDFHIMTTMQYKIHNDMYIIDLEINLKLNKDCFYRSDLSTL